MDNFFLDGAQALQRLASTVVRAFSPLFIGLALAYLFNRPAEWVRSKLAGRKSPAGDITGQAPRGRLAAILVTYAAVFFIIVLTVYAFVVLILGALPSGGLRETAANVYAYFEAALPEEARLWLEDKFSFSTLLEAAAGLAGGVVSFLLGLVASIYLLMDKEKFLALWQQFLSLVLKQRMHGLLCEIAAEIDQVLITFVRGALIDSMIVALLYSLALSIVQVKFAVMIGIIGGVLNVVPYFGPFFGMIPAFVTALVAGGPGQAVLAVLVLLGVQQLDVNFIYPKVVGSSIGLHPLFVLLSVSVFGYFGGIGGMLLAVPAAGILQVLIKKWAWSR